jgi:transcriptional regulator with XRE-family HTH domain
MTKIDPQILKRLREAQGWTQEKLAESTQIDKQTISRLERGDQSKTRRRTIEQLAHALNVAPEVLTGERPAPEESFDPRLQLDVQVAAGTSNALTLAALRYHVKTSQIVELAPLLFVWAAEESLRQRREQISAFGEKLDEVKALGRRLPHLSPPDWELVRDPEDAVMAEQRSIEKRDLFGRLVDAEIPDRNWGERDFDDLDNPFAVFLKRLVEPFGEVAGFLGWGGQIQPFYRICPEEAADLVGGDRDAAADILAGFVDLSEIPREYREAGMAEERAEWVRSTAAERRERFIQSGIGDMNERLSK